MNELRKAQVSKQGHTNDGAGRLRQSVIQVDATFHEFERFADENGSRTRAIVEYNDGTLDTVELHNITFKK